MSRISNAAVSMILGLVGKFYSRPKFRRWLRLEDIKHKIVQAIAKKEETFPDLLISYIAIAFYIPKWIVERIRWDALMSLFMMSVAKSVPNNKIPLLQPSNSKQKKEPWDYEGRTWYLYCHILAQKYGWNYSDIEKLDVDDALALIQEVLTDEHLDREFLWSMSENSYSYDVKTKTAKANPLDRPYWMIAKVEPPKKMKIPKSMMPAGADYGAIAKEFQPKEIEH